MMGEMAASTLFRGMASGTTHPVFAEMFQRIGRDESRHLQICMTILENEWPGLTEEVKGLITRQLRAGFVFLSMILWEPPAGVLGAAAVLPGQPPGAHEPRPRRRARRAVLRGAGRELAGGDGPGPGDRDPLGHRFPAIPELDIEGVDVADDINPEDIIPVF